jgi:uncharacterized protein (TIGR00106 family)
MSVMIEFSIVPMGRGASVSNMIAEVMKIVVDSGVSYRANPMGTVLEGEWDVVMGVVKRSHKAVMQSTDRAITTIKIDDRRGAENRMEMKLAAVEQKLGMKLER